MDASNTTSAEFSRHILHRIKFGILLVMEVPAWALSFLIIIFFVKNKAIRETLYHRALLILISVNFLQLSTTVPFAIRFYSMGYVDPASPNYCLVWVFIEFTCYTLSELFVAIIAIQRHVLIFNRPMLRIRWKRIVFHDMPLITCLVYSVILYILLILVYPCDSSQWDYSRNLCGFAPCYLVNKALGTFDWIAHNAIPTIANALANVILIIRVIRQKRRQQGNFTWKQQRRMTIQLLCISLLYIFAWIPCLTAGLGQLLVSPTFLAQLQADYFLDLIYSISLLLPWLCLALLPEFSRWIKRLGSCGAGQNAIGPTTNAQVGITNL